MDVERSFLTKVLTEKDIRPALDAKITPDFFEDEQNVLVWTWLLDHWSRYAKVPGGRALKANHPNWKPVSADEPLQFYIDQLNEARKYSLMQDTVAEAATLLKKREVSEAQAVLTIGIGNLNREVSPLRDVNLSDNADERIARYESYKDLPGGMRGIPTGFSIIDRATLGLQAEQLITLVGLPKAGKSTTLLLIGQHAQDYGKRVLFCGFEMSNEEQQSRYDAFRGKVNWLKMQSGTLNEIEEKRLHKAIRENANKPDFILVEDISSTTTLSGLAAKVEEHSPDLLIVDGVYLMEAEINADPGSAQALTSITRGMKRLAQKFKIPILQTTQVLPGKFSPRKGITMDSIGYTSSFAQDSDLALGVESTQDEEIKKLRILFGRNTQAKAALIAWDWDNGEFEEMEDDTDYDSDSDPV